jgi:hypothetical protein
MFIDTDEYSIAMKKFALLSELFVHDNVVEFSKQASGGMFYILTEIIQELTP